MSKEVIKHVSLAELLKNLPDGVAKVVERTGHVPDSGTGHYSGLNMVSRLTDERTTSNSKTLSEAPDRKEG